MAKQKSPFPDIPFVDENGFLTAEAKRWITETILPMAETQSDASSDPVPASDFNALLDKLQAAGVME